MNVYPMFSRPSAPPAAEVVAPTEAPAPSVGAPSLFIIVNDGWVEAHTIDGTYRYTEERWVFTPVLHPHLRLPVVDPEMISRLYASVSASGVLNSLLQTVADAR